MRGASVVLCSVALLASPVQGALALVQRAALKHHASVNASTLNGTHGLAANATHHRRKNRHLINGSQEQPSHEHQSGALPDVSAVLRAPHRVFTAMSSQLAALEARLAEVQHQSALAVSKQKALYESKLKNQMNEVHSMEVLNAQLMKKNDDIQKSNGLLRKKATTLSEQCESLQKDLASLETNVSVAAEFLKSAIGESNSQLHNATELTVLNELAEQDDVQQKATAYRERIGSVGMYSLLQVPATKSLLQPQELLQQMFASFDELPKEQNASEMALKAAFEKQYQIGADRLKTLLDEQTQINSTRRELHSIHDRLNIAVKHMENVHEQLLRRSKSTRVYLARLSGTGLPIDQ